MSPTPQAGQGISASSPLSAETGGSKREDELQKRKIRLSSLRFWIQASLASPCPLKQQKGVNGKDELTYILNVSQFSKAFRSPPPQILCHVLARCHPEVSTLHHQSS